MQVVRRNSSLQGQENEVICPRCTDWGRPAPTAVLLQLSWEQSTGPNNRTRKAPAFRTRQEPQELVFSWASGGRQDIPSATQRRTMGARPYLTFQALPHPHLSFSLCYSSESRLQVRVRVRVQATIFPPLLTCLNFHSENEITAISWEDQMCYAPALMV